MIGSLLDKLFVAVGADLTEFSTAMDQAGADAARASTQIVDNLNDAGQKGGVALSRMVDVAHAAITSVGPVLGDGLVAGVRDGIAKAVEVGAEQGPWAGLVAGAGEALQSGLTEILQGVATQIVPQLVASVTATSAWTASLTVLKGALATTIPIVQAVGAAFMSLMLSPLGLIIAAIAAVVAVWYYWDEIKPVIERVAAAVSDWWNANLKPTFDLVMGIIRQVVDFFKDYFGAQIENTINFISALFSGDFKGAWEAMKALVFTSITAVGRIIATLAPMALAAVTALVSAFGTWLGGLATRMVAWGRAIIDGLVNGINAAPQAVWNALKNVVLAGVNGIRDYLGIASPSRLMMEIGGFVTAGLAIGIDQGRSAVATAMRGLAGTVAEGIDPSSAELRRNVSALLDRLFPDQAAARKLEDNYAELGRGLAANIISPEAWAAAKERLDREAADLAARVEAARAEAAANTPDARLARDVGAIADRVLPDRAQMASMIAEIAQLDAALAANIGDPARWQEARARIQEQLDQLVHDMHQAGQAANDNIAEPFEDAAQRVANGVKDMVDAVSSALSDLKDAIQNGDIAGIIGGIANTIVAVIGAISQIKSGFGGGGSSAPTVPGRATGGNVSPFGTFIVGENGPEVLRMGAGGGRVYNATDTQKMLGGGAANDGGPVQVSIAVEASEYFDGRVAKITRPGMAQAAQQGALGGHAMTVKESRRNSSRRMPG